MKICRPKIPYHGPIRGGLRPGMVLYFKGIVHRDAHRFNIDLLVRCSRALHMCPQFDSSSVSFNTSIRRSWQCEEKVDKMPFCKGQRFELVFHVTKEGYQVVVNGHPFYMFKHRIPAQRVTGLLIAGGICIETIIIDVEGGELKCLQRGKRIACGRRPAVCPGGPKLLPNPFVGPIFGGLKYGTTLYCKGRIHPDAKCFHLNLQAGVMQACSKALHLVFLYDDKCTMVKCNTFQRARWEKEELPEGMPFSKGEAFELYITCTPEGFQVITNGKVFYMFKHRMCMARMKTIEVGGDVDLEVINVNAKLPEIKPPEPKPCKPEPPVTKAPMDVKHIYGGLKVWMSVYFKGTVDKDSKRFSINLLYGDTSSDFAFHFNPRFDEKKTVLNSCRNGEWEKQIMSDDLHFQQGAVFELLYVITPECYQVYKNGKCIFSFNHRVSVDNVKTIKVFGDVSMEIINIIEAGGYGGNPGYLSQARIFVPSIPYIVPIYGGLKPGMYIYFRGTVHRNAKVFSIDMQYHPRSCKPIKAFHATARFQGRPLMAFNTSKNGKYGKEERTPRMRFSKGKSFEIIYHVDGKSYRVYVNGWPVYSYNHRIPCEHVKFIRIHGDVSMETIDIMAGGKRELKHYTGLRVMAIQKIPHVERMYGGLWLGTRLYFHGAIPSDSEGFYISLLWGLEKDSILPLIFRVYFKGCERVEFNSLRFGKWQHPEKVNKMPFRRGEQFEMLFLVTKYGFQVFVNGRPFHVFKHRMVPRLINVIKIDGGVTLPFVKIFRGVPGALEGHPSLGNIIITKIPHVGPIYGGFRVGLAVHFRGTVVKDCKSFYINLQIAQVKGTDVALHFKVMLDSSEMVFNSFLSGSWGKEERLNLMPFSEGQNFELVFIITAQNYQVNINGRWYCVYKHRMPPEYVNAIEIGGEVTMQSVNMTEVGRISLLRHPGLGRITVTSIPFVGSFRGCLRTGMYLYFRGTIPEAMKSFAISLQYGEMDGCDIALHFQPAFTNGGGAVEMNSFKGGKWFNQEKIHQMPFQKGKPFELVFIITTQGYQVVVNGRPLHLFKHRMAAEQVSSIKITGDVAMETIDTTRRGQGIAGLRRMIVTKTPHVGAIYGGLRRGMILFFKGTIPKEMKSFAINLQYGELEGCDIALHFKPVFAACGGTVEFNSFKGGKWLESEIVRRMPFQPEKAFELVFIITPKGFQVLVNGQRFHFYEHRMPVEYISAINIIGDISVETVDTIGEEDDDEDEVEEDDEEEQPRTRKLAITKIPHVGPIHWGLRPGIALYFLGEIPENINSFQINLQCGYMQCCDKAFHMNVQYTPCELVKFNSFENNSWQKEERVITMPFPKGEDFEMVIYITSKGYQVNVNGEKFFFLHHRIPVELVSAINISGEISLEDVSMTLKRVKPEEEVKSISYVGPLYSGLWPGLSIYFKGTILQKPDRSSINLVCGDNENDDIALHISPRMDSNIVAFDTRRGGKWESLEKPAAMPFHRGEDFEVLVIITSDGYQVNVNGKELHFFKHRMPVQHVRAIRMTEGISVHTVNIIRGVQSGVQGHLRMATMVVNRIPYVGPIHGGVRPGMCLRFLGKAADNMSSFHISLQYGVKEGSEKALFFNARSEPSKMVVFSAYKDETWEKEEIVNVMPFEKGQNFEILFFISQNGYQVLVNGRSLYMFKHRIAMEYVSTLEIGGDVSIDTINVFGGGIERRHLRRMLVPKIPHVEQIYGGLRYGTHIYFRGTVPPNAKRFVIDLHNGVMKGSDIAFHFKAQLKPENVMVMNGYQNGKWGQQEIAENPFAPGHPFELVFIITTVGYQVIVNGRRFHLFKHRMPAEHVTGLTILHDVSIETLNMIGGGEGGLHPSVGRMTVTKIPHVGPVYGGLKQGMHVYFKGTVPQDMTAFAINLQCGQVEDCDIAFHFKAQFEPSEAVLFNTYQKGKWDDEERVTLMPFTKGQEFDLLFMITLRGYQVYVNGRNFYLFKHRVPEGHVTAINITGTISIPHVDLTEGGQGGVDEEPVEGEALTIPYVRSIPGGLVTGMYLYFKGTIPQEPKGFAINLQCGQMDACDKALHINPQSGAVVLNSFKDGAWQEAETVEKMPLTKGGDFELIIFVTPKGYQIFMNGCNFHLFKHRINVKQVSAVQVCGDVSMQTINIFRRVHGQPGRGTVTVSKIPHVGPICGGLRPWTYLRFHGTIPHSVDSFHINLQCGQVEGCDIALHVVQECQPSEVVVFKVFRSSNWEAEERVPGMPFRKGANFELLFVVTPEAYQVIVNGCHFHSFKHHIPIEYVTAVRIGGDISVHTIDTITRGTVGQPGQPGLGKITITKLPHVRPVFGGFRIGTALYFRGRIPSAINSFAIDLQCGELDGCDKAFHFGVRFGQSEMVLLNSFRGGKWEMEEQVDDNPFEPGEDFEMLFIVTQTGYQVVVDGSVFCTFLHRIPTEYVSAIKVSGDVSMEMSDIKEGVEPQPEKPKVFHKIPQMKLLSGGLRIGMTLHFYGIVLRKPERFSINLFCGDHGDSDRALHFNARFDTSEVVCNTYRNNAWEKQESVKELPFEAEEDFDLDIVVTSNGYKIIVDDHEVQTFKHRMPIENVTAIITYGDVAIQTINITEGGSICQGTMVVDRCPHLGHIHRALRTGTYLYFHGVIDSAANWFSISLDCGDNEGCEKALYFKPQFQPSKDVVLNFCQNKQWGKEVKVDMMPFKKGENFEVLFIVTAEGYRINVNGRGFYTFKHHVPVDRVSVIKIDGDVTVESINMIGRVTQGFQCLHKMVVPKIPHVAPVYTGFRTQTYLYFRGTVPENCASFSFNLTNGQTKDSDIAFSFNPQFKAPESVVFNSYKNEQWGIEDRVNEMPFTRGQAFVVVFIITSVGYQVLVNGRPFHFFKHRMSVEHVSAIKITGDIIVQTMDMTGGGDGALHPTLGKMVITKMPHVGTVYSGLRPGMFLRFRGTIPEGMKGFNIDLTYGDMDGSDTAFHFNPMFEPAEAVKFNSFRSSSWEKEELINMMPFTKGKNFELVYMITPEGYQVYVNGRHFYLFPHRMSVEHVTAIKIGGDVSMQTVDMTETGKGAPALPPPGPVIISTTPHLEPVSNGLTPGMKLYFRGSIPQVVKSFAINLQYGEMTGCDKALHMKVRFEAPEGVRLNSYRSGKLEEPVTVDDMPFKRGEDFEMAIMVISAGYQVIVNGRELPLFPHRMSMEQVTAVKIDGDVSMQSINIVRSGRAQPGLGMITIPEIPHVVPFYGGLRPEMYLLFEGTIPDKMNVFAVNLQLAEIEGSDIALHIKASGTSVTFNSFKNGGWGDAETVDVMPFTTGQKFEMLVLITSSGYQVNVNGRQVHFFAHRMTVQYVSAVNILGDVHMQSLNVIEGGHGGSPGKIAVTSIPHVGPVYGGLHQGMALFIQGTVPEDFDSLVINLQYGRMDGSDVAFHCKLQDEPRFMVFNSCKNTVWGEEERVDEMPLEEGESFQLAFIVTESGYEVIANGLLLHSFAHRIPVQQVTHLNIIGTIYIDSVNFIAGGDVQIKKKEEQEPVIETIPDAEPVPGVTKVGMALFFRGTIPSDIKSFTVNLLCGTTIGSDIALSFNSEFEPTEQVVLKCFQGGEWTAEEKGSKPMPFKEGESFELAFLITADNYQVYVNRRLYCTYAHRIPVDRINTVQVTGVCMQTTNLITEADVPKEEEADEDDDAGVTYAVSPISHTLKHGVVLAIMFSIPAETNWFSVALQCGATDDCDTAVQLSCRLDAPEAVFKTRRSGSWESEERVPQTVFKRGQTIVLVFYVTTENYEVQVNGALFHKYSHRVATEKVTTTKISENIVVLGIKSADSQAPEPEDEPEVETVQSVQTVAGGFWLGMILHFSGTIPEGTKSFSIGLQCAEAEGCDTAIRVSVKFETSEVVFNSFQNNGWEKEEKVDKMPFTVGQPFKLAFILTEKGYEVKANDTELYFFEHRIAIERLRAVRIAGGVSITNVGIEKAPEVHPHPSQLGTVQTEKHVHETLKMESKLNFEGTIPEETTSFSINLVCGSTKDSDVAFHLCAKFETSEVVLNTFQNGSWGQEEKAAKMPFVKGQPFVLTYVITDAGYQVRVHDEELHFYKHRIPLTRVTGVQIRGEVLIKIFDIKDPVPEYPNPTQFGVVQAVETVPGTLKTGMSMTFSGTIPQDIDRFCINLQCGDSDSCDTAFHVSLLFETSEVVFNTFRDGAWGEAERVAGMPFKTGEAFVMIFIVTSVGYQVMVNGAEFYLYKHRIALERVLAVQVLGNVTMATVSVIEHTVVEYPSPAKLGPVLSVAAVPGDLKSGMSMCFSGRIPENITRFCINLQCGDTDCCDTAFHFSPQFDKSVVLFNSYRNESWDEPEKATEMPFHKGQSFELLYNITSLGYQVKVNGNDLYFFNHRIPLNKITTLQIIGDVNLAAVNIVETAPSVVALQDGLKIGTMITFKGVDPDENEGFNIALQCGTEPGCDVAFNFSPEFELVGEVMMLNFLLSSIQGGSCIGAEKVAWMPISEADEFDLTFIVNEDGYQVDVNGEKVHVFEHRISIEQVRALQISGNVDIKTVSILEGAPLGFQGASGFGTVVVTTAPTLVPLPNGLPIGTSVELSMSIPEDVPSFTIDLTCGEAAGSNTAFRFNAEFEPEAELTFNSCQGGHWGQEETAPAMPLKRGQSYKVVIDITAEDYEVKVGGNLVYEFKHRIQVDQVAALLITGNINMEDLKIIEGATLQGTFGPMTVSGSLGGEKWTVETGQQQVAYVPIPQK